jgi:hypothetical protein
MILGDPITGFGGSTLRQAYAIFNEHTHSRVAGSCYNYNLRVGMFVSGVRRDGMPAFAPNTRIKEVGPDYFTVDTLLVEPANNLTITGIIQLENSQTPLSTTVENCTIDTQQQKVLVPPVGGEIPATLARAAELKLITGYFDVSKAGRAAVTTRLSRPQSSEFNIGGATFIGGLYTGDTIIYTPVDHTALAPVLINPPIPLALYELTGMLTMPNVQALPNLEAKVYLRKNLNELIPGHCFCQINGITPQSTYRYKYSTHGSITLRPLDTLSLVVEMVDHRAIPDNLYIHYTLSFLSLDESYET